ncbi:PDR/VanB family oxidoreductase [Lacisediminihabitans profunda]|uniref:Oxidoreductase n=1 Tax=Lacisediminihabitans profunda TaxID=2594790 RepID=A0A5C8US33_9MICO|nr:PDR/VanB family oxidoreductase [Lacisediminihabitans profunda]TXN30396.1 oxidoreductase [Lacisediminihabitans profunda]
MAAPPSLKSAEVLVRSVTWQADDVVSLALEPLAGQELPSWEPGAHIDVHLDDGTSRQYSLNGSAGNGYRISVLREPAGRGGSEYLHTGVRPGARLTISGPRNHFRLESAPSYVFVAGGIGITPMLPMLDAAERAGIPWHLYYFGRRRSSLAFLEELEALGSAVTVITKDDAAPLTVDDALNAHPSDSLVYVCGPPRLSEDCARVLRLEDRTDRLRFELFAAPVSPDDRPEDDGSFTVHLAESGLDLVVPAGVSILDTVLEAGIDVMHDCAEGICGSCETAVLSGTVDHRDFVLTDREKEESGCMMICVSRSTCPILVLGL